MSSGAWPGELGQVAGVAAQRGRHHRRHGQPARPGAVGGELALGHADQEHRVPLEALGAVDRQQLDRVGLRRRGDVEALAELVLGLQPGQQRGQRDLTVDGLELRHRLHEQVEVVAAGRRGRAHRRGQLHVDAGGVDDPADQVEDRLADRRRAAAAARRRAARSAPRLRGVGEVARVLERVAERGDLGGVGALDGGLELVRTSSKRSPPRRCPASSRARRPEQRQVARPIAQRGPASSVSSAALAVTSWTRVSVATTSATSGSRSSPLRPTISTGISRSTARRRPPPRGVVAGEDPDLLPARPGHRGAPVDDPVGQPGQLVVVGLVHHRAHLAGAAAGLGLQRQQLRPGGVEVGGEVVGGREDPLVGAPVDGERVRHGAAVGGREVVANSRMLETEAPRQP